MNISPEPATGIADRSFSRRRLLQLGGATVAAAMLDTTGPRARAIGSNLWSNPATWGGSLPLPGAVATIVSNVILDIDTLVGGVVIQPGGSLVFDAATSRNLVSTGNVIVKGTLTMRPSGTAVHRLTFPNVNEAAFVGEGMDVVASDVGLWVMEAGVLDLVGATKTAWARLAGDGLAGSTVLGLDRVPTGWRVGDRIAVSPTSPYSPTGTLSWTGFSESTISAVSGSQVTLSSPLAYDHRKVNATWGAEVLNLTRSVNIEGTPSGRTHVFIRSSRPQVISHAALRHTGPRKGGEKIVGRWPLHLHHCEEGSRGTVVEDVVVTDAGSHAFVPHTSHGITFRNCIAYAVEEHAFWWDTGHTTNDVLWESCVAARVTSPTDLQVGGFYLGKGSANAIRLCTAVGVDGADAAGIFSPPMHSDGQWVVEDCVSHNNQAAGFRAYINTDRASDKVVTRLDAYHNKVGVKHGAYRNSFLYDGGRLYGNANAGIELNAVSGTDSIEFVGLTIDSAGVAPHGVVNSNHISAALRPTIFRSCILRGHTVSAVGLTFVDTKVADLIDLVSCTFEGNELWMATTVNKRCEIRVQDVAHGTIRVRRRDQPGTLVPAWNARSEVIPPFA